MTKLDWRKIETELVDIARSEGYAIDSAVNGDKIIDGTDIELPISLTSLAKELAERLK